VKDAAKGYFLCLTAANAAFFVAFTVTYCIIYILNIMKNVANEKIAWYNLYT